MNSSTRSISLVLIGSLLAFGGTMLLTGGCNRADEGGDWGPDANQNQNQQNQGGHYGGGYHRGGFVPIPIFIGGGGGGGGRPGGGTSAPSAAPSGRGGFGGTGGGFGGTSAS
jgi:translation initiation factor IF-2